LFECHTAYTDNREYLKKLPSYVKQLLVPSEIFKNVLIKEYPSLAKKIKVLDNFIYRFPSSHQFPNLFENKIPLLSIGRLDELKNPLEIIRITSLLKGTFGDMFILFLVGADYMGLERVFSFAAEHGLAGRVVYLPHIAFTKTHDFFRLMKKNRGVYISASTGETFGMAVAEAMTYGLPVLLSDIDAHKRLCNNDQRLLYKLNNINDAALKLGDLIKNWDDYNQLSETLSHKFDSAAFLKQWTSLMKQIQIKTNQSA
jgi:glycosyltransferase involved in cell wall biosynthesis